ncbi:DNA cytosine methyltransferase [Devosia sp. J2-20]|uniref:DNA cytosine methyltransferase n=1 Tax=Devosia sp. J2-20 TaxID=3026161 RepID=UPI00249A9DF8|nr:DNA cytosine methyltransferase [Devosia sp. J2-20]WDQ98163.1 DNA cytosine methyltransferase [Devosia sp. J2-20]
MRVIDLFCGTGGFSLGARTAGLEIVRSVDIDPVLTSTYKLNFPGSNMTLGDVSDLTGEDLKKSAHGHVDGLIGGPPCQGFSLMGKRDELDPRRLLVDHFFRLVAELRPTFFVMENVVGLMQGEARTVLDNAISRLPSAYALTGPTILDASDFGVATNRKRVFVVGVLAEYADLPTLTPPAGALKATVRDAIADLALSREIGSDVQGFDLWELPKRGYKSTYAETLRSQDRRFTGNQRTVHSDSVTQRFATVVPGKSDLVGRHQRLSWDGLCPTLRAGTGSDRGSFQSVRPLHPDEPRVITVREAARLQGFPDIHRFHPTIWHSFRMIGNSVSPPVAAGVLRNVIAGCEGSRVPHPIAAE